MAKYRIIQTDKDPSDLLTRKSIPFTVEIGSRTSIFTIESTKTKYIVSQNRMDFSQLGFIGRTKKSNKNFSIDDWTEKQYIEETNKLRKEINYFRFANIRQGIYKDIVEVDVNKAYWFLAYNLGMITKDVYEEGLRVKKSSRIIGFGSLATKKEVYNYYPNSDSYVHQESKFDAKGRYSFFKTAYELDKIMMEVYSKIPIMFYWVDAFFIESKYKKEVNDIIESFGLSLKTKEVDMLEVYKDENSCDVFYLEMKGGEKKSFIVPNKNLSAKNILGYKNVINKFRKKNKNLMVNLKRRRVYQSFENGRFKSNISDLKGRKGVYQIFDEKNKRVYIGHSTSCLYSTILRHFQTWNQSRFEQLQKINRNRITYESKEQKLSYSVKVTLTNKIDAYPLEQTLIEKYRPRDNSEKISAINEKKKQRMIDRFNNAKSSRKNSLPKGKIKQFKYKNSSELEADSLGIEGYDGKEAPF